MTINNNTKISDQAEGRATNHRENITNAISQALGLRKDQISHSKLNDKIEKLKQLAQVFTPEIDENRDIIQSLKAEQFNIFEVRIFWKNLLS